MQLHPEIPPVPLLRPMHLRTARIAFVPGRRRCRNDGGVNDAALLQQDFPRRPSDPQSPERQALQPAAEVGPVVSSRTFSSLAPARRRTGKLRKRLPCFLPDKILTLTMFSVIRQRRYADSNEIRLDRQCFSCLDTIVRASRTPQPPGLTGCLECRYRRSFDSTEGLGLRPLGITGNRR